MCPARKGGAFFTKGDFMKKLISIMLVLLLALLTGCAAEEEQAEAVEVPADTPTAAVPIEPAAEEQPTEWDAGSGLKVVSVGKYAGYYVEDGSDETVSDVCAITVENTSDKTVQYANLAVIIAGQTYEFDVTTLPAGARAQLLELNRKAAPETTSGLSAVTVMYGAFDEEPSLNSDVLEITGEDTAITVKNISDKDLGQIYVYYKVAYDNLYIGGITYRVGISSLAAGQSVTCYAGHYTVDYASIMFTTYEQ